ncbi:MAG: DUF58 domain-containing protein [Planctomycetota bacterium]
MAWGFALKFRGTITLGPGGVLYLVVAALILAAAIYTQANLLFGAFGLVMGGLVVSAAWSLIAMRGVEVRREVPAAGVAGRATVIRYTVHNRSRLPAFSVVIEEMGSDRPGGVEPGAVVGWVAHVGPGQRVNVEAPCWPSRRGEIEFVGVEVWTAFPFGVFRRVVRREMTQRLLVLPSLRRIDRRWLPTSPWSAGYGTKQRGGASDAGEFFGLRDYREGDPPRLIDWKRSARLASEANAKSVQASARLIARELTQPTPPRVMVLLDLHLDDAADRVSQGMAGSPDEEDAITLAASLLDAAHRQGFWSGLAVLGPSCPVFAPQLGLPHRARMLEALARLDLSVRDQTPRAGMIVPSVVIKPGLPTVIAPGDQRVDPNNVTTRSARVLYGGELAALGTSTDPDTVDVAPEEWLGASSENRDREKAGAA